MGMFDYLRVEIEIPGCGDCSAEEFQTKSLDNMMYNYVITTKGELYKEEWEYEWIEDNTRPLTGGYMKKIEGSYNRRYLTEFHGDVIFYDGRRYNGKWRQYYARFTEGKLTKMWYEDVEY